MQIMHAVTFIASDTICTGWSKKTDTQFYFWDNFGNSAPILTILSLLQAEINGEVLPPTAPLLCDRIT